MRYRLFFLLAYVVLFPVRLPADVLPTPQHSASVVASPKPEPEAPKTAVPQPSIVLDDTIALTFNPKVAYYFVEINSGRTQRYPALMVPPYRNDGESGPRKWVFGARVSLPESAGTLTYSILVVGQEDRIAYEQPKEIKLPVDDLTLRTEDLRDRLLQQKDALRSWQVQMKTQEASLQRLRADAEVVGNLGRVIEVKEELDKVRRDIQSLESAQKTLQEFLRLARSRPAPKNVARRESQLTIQLSELAQAAKEAERQEILRRSRGESDTQRKLSLIEMTRNEDYDELQRELLRVRRHRLQLEREVQTTRRPASPEPAL